ncbi:MAG TPA: hypothetical protein GXX69_00075 [Firmicutes bacterium]|nr:hypothetical protein [Bacillota bacterium]
MDNVDKGGEMLERRGLRVDNPVDYVDSGKECSLFGLFLSISGECIAILVSRKQVK